MLKKPVALYTPTFDTVAERSITLQRADIT